MGYFTSNHAEGCLFEVHYLSHKWATRTKETKATYCGANKRVLKTDIFQVFTSQLHQSGPQSVPWDILDKLYLKAQKRHRHHDASAIQELFIYIKASHLLHTSCSQRALQSLDTFCCSVQMTTKGKSSLRSDQPYPVWRAKFEWSGSIIICNICICTILNEVLCYVFLCMGCCVVQCCLPF